MFGNFQQHNSLPLYIRNTPLKGQWDKGVFFLRNVNHDHSTGNGVVSSGVSNLAEVEWFYDQKQDKEVGTAHQLWKLFHGIRNEMPSRRNLD